jgi:iron-sulfur cluster assembly protein|nr:iron-sulfur cluster assembly accessory protein [Candidatus Krumholzibacteria bacterium]
MRHMIHFTESTLAELRRRAGQDPSAGAVVRLGVKPGGCSGTTYVLEFTDQARAQDQTVALGEFEVAIAPQDLPLLTGLEVDFVDSLVGGGFRFKNPNAARTCGCGSSFQPRQVPETLD